MEDYEAMFRRIIKEHKFIAEHVQLAGESVGDRAAIDALRRAREALIPGWLDVLTEKRRSLQRTLALLAEGLQNHFAFEGRYLPPFVGDILMTALAVEHRQLIELIAGIKSAASVELEGLSEGELLAKETEIRQLVDALSRTVGEHAAKEGMLLEMLRKGFEDKGIKIAW